MLQISDGALGLSSQQVMVQHTGFWYLVHRRAVKAQKSPHICADWPEPLLLTYTLHKCVDEDLRHLAHWISSMGI